MQKTSHLEKEPSKSSWNTNLLLPLVADTVFVSEILDERFFIENPDQSISLAFEEELFDLNMDAYLPDTLIFYGLRLGFIQDSLIHQPGDTILSQSFSLPIDIMNGNDKVMILKKAILNSGNITFEAHQVSQTNLLVVLGIDGF
ncbi:MAG: hypothetical protein B7C24_15145 [Bacteroidetes bacterium 4572_77]|nr:MAG: hypothetical protein B7C24_15145 [Bacteroidetes bacterium 4572_77]